MFLRVEVKNSERIVSKLVEIEGVLKGSEQWGALGQSIVDEVSPYPPATIANSPANPSGRWYERGLGVVKRSGKVYKTSQNLFDQWYVQAQEEAVEVGNNATYAGFVHGTIGQQAFFHAARGWKSLYDTAIEKLPQIVQNIQNQINRIWGGS